MKKESDMIQERNEWIKNVSQIIEKRTFEMLEKKVEQNQWEYWENRFIPVQYSSIQEIGQEVFKEEKEKALEENYPNIANEIWKIVFNNLEEQLALYGFKLGTRKHEKELGIGAIESDLIAIGEKNNFSQKIKKLFEKKNLTDNVSTESFEKPQQIEEKEEIKGEEKTEEE